MTSPHPFSNSKTSKVEYRSIQGRRFSVTYLSIHQHLRISVGRQVNCNYFRFKFNIINGIIQVFFQKLQVQTHDDLSFILQKDDLTGIPGSQPVGMPVLRQIGSLQIVMIF